MNGFDSISLSLLLGFFLFQLVMMNVFLAQMANRQVQTLELEQGQSSEPIGDFIHSDPFQDHDSSDTSLKLGLVYSTRFS